MGKVGLTIGAFLLGAAVVLFGYRWQVQPNWGRTHHVTQESRGAPAGASTRSADGQRRSGQQSAQQAPQQTQSQPSGFQLFEAGLNVANVLVGLFGIWMMMRGGRSKN